MNILYEELLKTRLSFTDILLLLKLYVCGLWCGNTGFPCIKIHNGPRVSVLFQDKNQCRFYCVLPEGYALDKKAFCGVSPEDMFSCPLERNHEIYRQLSEILKIIRARSVLPEYESFCKIIQVFLEKFHPQKCIFCKIRAKDLEYMKIKYKSKQTDILIDEWYYGYRLPKNENTDDYLKIHFDNVSILLNQVNSEKMKKWIIRMVYSIFREIVPKLIQLLLDTTQQKNGKDIYPFQMFSKEFRNKIFENIKMKLHFISCKKINFEKWFESLFRFHILCNIPIDEIDANDVCPSALFQFMLVLHDMESMLEKKNGIITGILYKDGQTMECNDLGDYHPFLRGNAFRIIS